MRAVDAALRLVEMPDLTPGPGEVRIAVAATAVNRADLIQQAGHYAPPAGASPILGLECAGRVDAVGEGVERWSIGDRVCALLSGGGYASQVVVPASQVLDAGSLPFEVAAALPEAICTAHDALMVQARLLPGERVLLHAGASGVGTTAIQLCREQGSPCFVTVGSAEKVRQCVDLGAQGGWNRHDGPFTDAPWLAQGVDVILDPVGRGYLASDLKVLNRRDEIDLGRVLVKRLNLIGTVLRSRTLQEKTAVIRAVQQGPWPAVLAGRIHPIIDRQMPLSKAEDAHAAVASNATTGKVVLTIDD